MPEIIKLHTPLHGVVAIVDGVERPVPDARPEFYRELVVEGQKVLDDATVRMGATVSRREFDDSNGELHLHFMLHERCVAAGRIFSREWYPRSCEHSPINDQRMYERCRETHTEDAPALGPRN